MYGFGLQVLIVCKSVSVCFDGVIVLQMCAKSLPVTVVVFVST